MKKKPVLTIGLSLLVALVAVTVLVMVGSATEANLASLEVVATGLQSPRHMTFGPDGALYVAEAGFAGAGPCILTAIGPSCVGNSAGITRITSDSQQRVLSGALSLGGPFPFPDGSQEGLGLHDVWFDGSGNMFGLYGLGASPTNTVPASGTLNGMTFATIVEVGANDTVTPVLDIGAYELAANPDMGLLDTNPFTFVDDGAGTIYIADAGGNAVLETDGVTISTTAVFSNRLAPFWADFPTNTIPISIPMQAVPTSVAINPDGELFVGQLTGFPFPPGFANVYRIPDGGDPEVFLEGFTNIVDIEFDADGNLYVLEMATNGLLGPIVLANGEWTGALKRIDTDGDMTTIASEGLHAPTGMAIGSDGWIYISNKGLTPDEGEVVRVRANSAALPIISNQYEPGAP